jgi:hypothetical protein
MRDLKATMKHKAYFPIGFQSSNALSRVPIVAVCRARRDFDPPIYRFDVGFVVAVLACFRARGTYFFGSLVESVVGGSGWFPLVHVCAGLCGVRFC